AGDHTLLLLPFFFSCYADHRDLHSFPTRRSSDLDGVFRTQLRQDPTGQLLAQLNAPLVKTVNIPDYALHEYFMLVKRDQASQGRSEEHTSELQSRENLVCRLLLEKKKKTKIK